MRRDSIVESALLVDPPAGMEAHFEVDHLTEENRKYVCIFLKIE